MTIIVIVASADAFSNAVVMMKADKLGLTIQWPSSGWEDSSSLLNYYYYYEEEEQIWSTGDSTVAVSI